MGHDISTARMYLDHVLRTVDLSPTALARKAGLSDTTITRFLNKEGYANKLSPTTIRKIEGASGVRLIALAGKDSLLGTLIKHENGQQFLLKPDGSCESFTGYLAFDVDAIVPENPPSRPVQLPVPFAGTVSAAGAVQPGNLPENFRWPAIHIPFDPHEPAQAWYVDSDAMRPRYGAGDVLLCWGEGRPRLGKFEELEGILWAADGTARFGIVSIEDELYRVDVVGARPARGIAANRIDIIRAVVREGEYVGVRLPEQR